MLFAAFGMRDDSGDENCLGVHASSSEAYVSYQEHLRQQHYDEHPMQEYRRNLGDGSGLFRRSGSSSVSGGFPEILGQ